MSNTTNNTNNTTTFLVPFEEQETVWNNRIAIVTATSSEEAVRLLGNSSNPYDEFEVETNGINTVTETFVCSEKYDFLSSVEDVIEIDELSKFILSQNSDMLEIVILEDNKEEVERLNFTTFGLINFLKKQSFELQGIAEKEFYIVNNDVEYTIQIKDFVYDTSWSI